MKLGLLILVTVIALAQVVLADGMIVPVDPTIPIRGAWSVKYHNVSITVRDQVAEVHIDQAFVNLGDSVLEVEYLFPIPPGAAIDQMTLMADGQEFAGRLLPAEEARRIYEEIVRRRRDPALLEYVGYGLYKTSVFPIPARAERRVVIHYTQVLDRDGDLVELMYPLNTEKFSARPIDEVSVTVDIHGQGNLGPVYSPSHELTCRRLAPNHVRASYRVENAIPNTDFQLLYQDRAGAMGATVLSYRPDTEDEGYFMALVTPPIEDGLRRVIPKDIVLVLDHSGSMGGAKLDQARRSVAWILENLNEGDRFNVVSFASSVDTLFVDDLVPADGRHIERAQELIDRISASGDTAIEAAAERAMQCLADRGDRPGYVLFLTDGKPTVGDDLSERAIRRGVEGANDHDARLFCLGVGYDVNVRLLDLLAQDNGGLSRYVRENEPIEDRLAALYDKIRSPVLTDVEVRLAGLRTSKVYPGAVGDLFDGEQLVMVGRYDDGGGAVLEITGRVDGRRRSFEFPVELVHRSEDIGEAYLPRVWAMRRVGFLLDQIALHGEQEELTDEIVCLSRDYGIMTPYTSFLADDTTDLASTTELHRRGREMASQLERDTYDGWGGQNSAALRRQLNEAVAAQPQARSYDQVLAPGGAPAGPTTQPMTGVMIGNSEALAFESQRAEQVANLRQVGQNTLYRRGDVWMTPDIAAKGVEPDDEDVRTVAQFSDEYFELARANNAVENGLLAMQQPGEQLLLNLRGQAYRIIPAE